VRGAVRRAVGFIVETLAFFATMLFAIWAMRRLRNAVFISLMAPLALAGSGTYSTCYQRKAVS